MIDFDNDYRMLIDGGLHTSGNFIFARNPATEAIIAKAPDASREQLESSVAAAKRAFPAWRDLPIAERQQLVAEIGFRIERNAEELKRLLTLEQGKARAGADWEIDGSAIWCREIAKQSLGVEIPESTDERHVETRRVPLGVTAGIVPWNFPVLLAVWKIAPALVAGNTMVLKPSPYTPLCTLKLGELVQDLLPPGVLNIVTGGDDLGRWMTEHADIRKISFTGSTDTGKKIMASASGNLKRITLELGGNDPAIVLPDVDAKEVARDLFWAAFQNSAQFCVAAKRIYIHEEVYDAVARELVEYARGIKVGDGLEQGSDLGPIQNKMQYEKVCDLLRDAHETGLNFLIGGEPSPEPGYFVPITIIDNPPERSRVVQEEAFGPILPLLKFSDVEDVIRRANASDYGLAASVWSKDVEAGRAIAKRLECGTVWINEIHIFGPHIAFGGHKQSGMGVENSLDGLAEYTNPKTVITRLT